MKKDKEGKSLIRESLVDYNNLATHINENAADLVKQLLGEQVREAYASILNESDDDEDGDDLDKYEVEEVDDTESAEDDTAPADSEASDDTEEDEAEGMESEDEADFDADEAEGEEEETEEEDEEQGIGGEFDKYKVSDGKYDFRDAKDDDIVKVYKLLKDDDSVTVERDSENVKISDNETGAEYIVALEDDEASTSDEFNNEEEDAMTESTIYEIALNEYDSHVGYNDGYQKKDVMTSDGVSEPGRGRDIDKGVPHTAKKPWSSQKKAVPPFNAGKGKSAVKECGDMAATNEPEVDESLLGGRNGVNGPRGMRKSHVSDTVDIKPKKGHVVSKAGKYLGNVAESANSIADKAQKIFEENKKLKEKLDSFTKNLEEAAVMNTSLGGIIKLISENSTSMDEKRDIINRFTNEVHSIDESKNLYERISKELKAKPKANANINEEVKLSNSNSEVINESKFYQDESLMGSLGLMHRICK